MSQKIIPIEFIKRWEAFFGKPQTESIVTNLSQRDIRVIVPNSLKTDRTSLKLQLEKKHFKFIQTNEFNGLFVEFEPFNIVSTPEYLSGLFSIQALSSLIPPLSLQPSSDSIVVDLTASPGIKTCFLAQQMNNQGTIIAIEKSKKRLAALNANLARMGVMNTIVINFDALNFSKLDILADYILLDAPCSGTGLKVIKNKRMKPKIFNDIKRHAQIQKALLEEAWSQLKPKGALVYSTCSLEPEEGEVQISTFLDRYKNGVSLLPIPFDIGSPGSMTNWKDPLNPQLIKTKRIFPNLGYDGFFIAILKKSD